ncbi:hypothetical protein [Staphylococcus sp. GDY8P57P]|uniref:hypothetical protein n=1 Tax=Staphylococcus sp. GDY8P57P TaxID=2804128 RepID=UPI0018814658|nr:hypothetical protein [Staphylococcus sp. GDY8P57P]MBF2756595.1 hypothetical protein [Staphylococcus haemolyticus]MBF2774481.1 hypothetical protein [Staphylococcus haemolyticus]MBF2775017.1 hypothetical protein [Staphylococcus haemolyticus]MBF2816489.1 hypothetical protein [Staphylococcus haemolyticus]MBF9721110.1 hypothetical protein [Staphylococcus haemolyticus]
MIIINNKGINDFDFSFWMNNQLTADNIDEILEASDLSMEQEFFKDNYKKILDIDGKQERWYSLEEAAYIINGNYFSIYEEDSKKRNVTTDYVKNKSNNILNNIQNRTNQNWNEYHYPQKRKFAFKKAKYVNEDMIDEILRDDVTKPEKIKQGNISIAELLPNQNRIAEYIRYNDYIYNKSIMIDYLNQLSNTLAQSLDDVRNFSNKLSLFKSVIKVSREAAENIHRSQDIDNKEKYELLKKEYSNLLENCLRFSNKYLDILDIKSIFNIYDTKKIVLNMSDYTKMWEITDVNNEQPIKNDLQKFVDLKKKKYSNNVHWSKNKILKQLNEIEVNPVVLKEGISEIERVAEWMYRNKTKVVYGIINKEFDDVYELLNGILKSEYTKLMGYMRIWYN